MLKLEPPIQVAAMVATMVAVEKFLLPSIVGYFLYLAQKEAQRLNLQLKIQLQ